MSGNVYSPGIRIGEIIGDMTGYVKQPSETSYTPSIFIDAIFGEVYDLLCSDLLCSWFRGRIYPKPEGERVAEIGKDGLLIEGVGRNEEEMPQDPETKKTVMVYLRDKSGIGKEPIGVIAERRKSERDNNNAIGMVRLARKEFAKTEEEAQRIIIGPYV